MLEAVYTLDAAANLTHQKSDGSSHLSSCYLALGEEVFYIVDKQEDMLMRAFYLSQIDLRTSSDDSTLLVVTLNKEKEERNDEDVVMDRLVDFVLQTSKFQQEI